MQGEGKHATQDEDHGASVEAAARAMFDYHHGGAGDYDPNFAWADLDDWAREYWRELAEAALSHSPAEVERLRKVLQTIMTAGWDGNWAADVAREALEFSSPKP